MEEHSPELLPHKLISVPVLYSEGYLLRATPRCCFLGPSQARPCPGWQREVKEEGALSLASNPAVTAASVSGVGAHCPACPRGPDAQLQPADQGSFLSHARALKGRSLEARFILDLGAGSGAGGARPRPRRGRSLSRAGPRWSRGCT